MQFTIRLHSFYHQIYSNFFYGNEHDFFKVKPYMNHVVPFYEKWGLHRYFFYLNFADKQYYHIITLNYFYMKKLFIAVACIATMASCSTIRTSSVSAVDVATAVVSANQADLEVATRKISYTYVPTKQDRKTGLKNVVNNAVTEALKENGNADVLVHMNYDATLKRKGKIKKVIITGYPAKYTNFKINN